MIQNYFIIFKRLYYKIILKRQLIIILKNIIRTSQDIGFKTLCEGIETEEQEQAAIKAGCDLLQGFYYYKPMPVAMLETLFDNSKEGV